MKAFRRLDARAVPLLIDDIDTDMLFPARFAKTISDTGFGDCLLAEQRFRPDGSPIAGFALNRAEHAGAQILISGANFGCGSSREHAVWALRDFGFRAIVAESFADILYQNCFKNGLLPVSQPRAVIEALAESVAADPAVRLVIDLERATLSSPAVGTVPFGTDPYRRDMLLRGLDEIGLTLEGRDRIETFVEAHFGAMPWLRGSVPGKEQT